MSLNHIATSQRSVVVIGGGLAGQAAALALVREGWRVIMVESRRVLGGRVGSFEDGLTQQAVDYCQHVGMACCTNLMSFMQRMRLAAYWQRETSLYFYASDGKELRFDGSWLPAPLHLSKLLLAWPQLTWTERLRIGWGLWRLMRLKLDPSTSKESAVEWLKRHHQTESTLQKFWSTILVSALGDQIDRLAMGLVRKVMIDGFASNRHAYELLVPTIPLRRLCGELAAAQLTAEGVDVRTNCSADEILWREGFANGIRLANGEVIDAHRVIVAVPWFRAAKLLTRAAAEAPPRVTAICEQLDAFESSPITGIHTWWDRDWLRTPHAILVNRYCQWIFRNTSQSKESSQEHYLQVVISGSRDLPRGDQASIVASMLADLNEVFPASRAAKLIRWRIVTDPQAVFAWPPGTLGMRPSVDQLASHRVWLCGDWTNTGWPATMEGAVCSGFMAAEAICQSYGETRRICAESLCPGVLARWLIRQN